VTFWIDEQLPPELAAWLGARFRIIAKTLKELGLQGVDDAVLIAAAKRFGQIVIVTKDSDFATHVLAHGAPPQVLWLRCGNLSTNELQAWLGVIFADALRRLEADEACVELNLPSRP
jgi:predicted nuclease of predicted toxin-antitoxin system